MDKRGHRTISPEEHLLALDIMELESNEDSPKKVNVQDFQSSPEYQRALKIARERTERAHFENRIAFRAAQEQNPIRARPRKKRGRKRR